MEEPPFPEQTARPIDIAISFTNEDLGLAMELRDKLGKSLNVFVYAANQEKIAGTDGLESFRRVFRYDARLVVILYRAGWCKTNWTKVEEEAVTDRFLKEGAGFLFVVMLDDSAPRPWIPDKLIKFNLKDFGVEQEVGAIKARALEQGSKISKPTAAQLAKDAEAAAIFLRERAGLFSREEGVKLAAEEAHRFVTLFDTQAAEAKTAAPTLQIEHGAADTWAGVRIPGVAVQVTYINRIVNVLDKARLEIREIRGPLLLPAQQGYYIHEPKTLVKTVFRPELSRALGWGWISEDGPFFTSEQLAHWCIERFLHLVRRFAAGEFPDFC